MTTAVPSVGSVSVKDVAQLAGVSLGTVSNVLNRPERVGEATRQRVLAAIADLGYVRNEAARQLRAGRSRTIGLLVLDVGNPFFTDLAGGVEVAAERAGLTVVLCSSGENLTRQDHYLGMLQEMRTFGILITPVTAGAGTIERLRASGTPVVLVDRVSGRSQCSVSVDDVTGGELAMAHLLAAGHRRVGYVAGPRAIEQVSDRLAGARQALAAADRPARDLTVLEGPALTVAAGRRAGEQIATTPARRRPTAVFCANDLLALGVLQEMTQRQLRVPEDLAIVGYDDIDFAAAAAVPLTSIRQPSAQLGQAAAELLIEEVEHPDSHRHRQVVFEPELVVRSSEPGVVMRIALIGTCLGDALFPQVLQATTTLLERLGHEVVFPPAQSCCGQMHVNTGYLAEALPVVRHHVEVFDAAFAAGADVAVAPSGSCVGSIRHQQAMVARRAGDLALAARAAELAARTYELSELLVDVLGVTDVGASYPHRVAYHPTCHSLRMLQVGDKPLALLRAVRGLELVAPADAEVCCGFGGTFAVKNPGVSAAMLADKVAALAATGAEVCAAGDASCLMHIGGGLSRARAPVRTVHLAEILASTEVSG